MGKLRISTAMTVDGLVDVTGWYVPEGGHDRAGLEELDKAEAMLLGRKTYEGLAGYWPSAEGDWADLINPMPKYVVSRTLDGPLEWNATLLEGDAASSVAPIPPVLGLPASLPRDDRRHAGDEACSVKPS